MPFKLLLFFQKASSSLPVSGYIFPEEICSGLIIDASLLPGLDCEIGIADEHYLPTFFHVIDPGGITNWSVKHVDWSQRKWHPKSCRDQDDTDELLKKITSEEQVQPFLWNGIRQPYFLFGRKFYPETLKKLMMVLKF